MAKARGTKATTGCEAQALGRPLVRLDVAPQQGRRLEVLREGHGRINGLSIITTGPALGHGFYIDRETVEAVARFTEGMPGRWTHGGLSDDGLGRHLGRWTNARAESFQLCRACLVEATGATCTACGAATELAWRAVGDFQFTGSGHKIQPDGLNVPAPVYLMDRAEEDPSTLGVSIVARFGFYEPPAREGEQQRRFGRLEGKQDLRRGDFVADPAANPIGLHAGTGALSALSEEASSQIDRLVARLGRDGARARALAFVDRVFARGGQEGRMARNLASKGIERILDEELDDEDAPSSAGSAPPQGDTEARLAALEDKLAAKDAKIEALEAKVAAHEAAEKQRKKDAADAYVCELRRTAAVKLQQPIPEDDLKKVEAALARGDEDTAKALGEAFLARAEAKAALSRGDEKSRPVGEDDNAAKAAKETVDGALSAVGFERKPRSRWKGGN